MIHFDSGESDVLGTLHHKGERYQFRVSDGAEPDVYRWRKLSNDRNGWAKMSGIQQAIAIADIRRIWYSAGGTNSKQETK